MNLTLDTDSSIINGVITAYVGENDEARLAAVRQLTDGFVTQYGDVGLEQFDGESSEYDQLLEAVQSLPFLVDRKLVVIRQPSQCSELVERFEDFIRSVTDEVDVLLVESKIDKRTAFFKHLQKLPDFKEFKELNARELTSWAVEYVKENGGQISHADASYLVNRIGDVKHVEKRTGADQLLLRQEIDKLLIADNKISRRSIDALVEESPASRIFDLLEAAFSGNQQRTIEIYANQKAQGVDPQAMIPMIAWQLHVFAVIKAGRGKTTSEIASQAKLSPYVVERSMPVANRMNWSSIKRLVSDLLEIDEKGKTSAINLDDALQYFLLTIYEE